MKKFRRSLAIVLAAIALAVTLGTLLPRPLWRAAAANSGATRHILVAKSPIHTDIAIPVDDDVRARVLFLTDAGISADTPGVRYIAFGWGGRAFYLETPTWAEMKPLPTIKALTLDDAVMHVAITGNIVEPDSNIDGFDVSEERFTALLDFIAAGFRQGSNGPVVIDKAAYSKFDRFYEANGSFNALVGCNTWTAAALRAAGLRTGWWNPLPASLGLSLRLFN